MFITEYDSIQQSDAGVDMLRRAAVSSPNVPRSSSLPRTILRISMQPSRPGRPVFCVKTAEPEDLASAIRQAFHSSVYYASSRGKATEEGSGGGSRTGDRRADPAGARDLQLVAEGHSNSQLARMLWVTEQTVKFHLSNIYRSWMLRTGPRGESLGAAARAAPTRQRKRRLSGLGAPEGGGRRPPNGRRPPTLRIRSSPPGVAHRRSWDHTAACGVAEGS